MSEDREHRAAEKHSGGGRGGETGDSGDTTPSATDKVARGGVGAGVPSGDHPVPGKGRGGEFGDGGGGTPPSTDPPPRGN